MDNLNIKLLEESMAKWEKCAEQGGNPYWNADGMSDPEACPLCVEYYEQYCEGCPVHEDTGDSCTDSPYIVWSDFRHECSEERQFHAERMYAYLGYLLVKEQDKQAS